MFFALIWGKKTQISIAMFSKDICLLCFCTCSAIVNGIKMHEKECVAAIHYLDVLQRNLVSLSDSK